MNKKFIISIGAVVLFICGLLLGMFGSHLFVQKSNIPPNNISQISGEIVHVAKFDGGRILYIQKLNDRPSGELFAFWATEELLADLAQSIYRPGVTVRIQYTLSQVDDHANTYPVCGIEVLGTK